MKIKSSLRRLKVFSSILWKKISKIEKAVIALFLLTIILDLFGFFGLFLNKNGNFVPQKGGVLVEGVVGQAEYINPLYAKSDTDKALSSLVFSGLVAYNKQREIIPALAEKWEVSQDKKIYKFFLKKNIKWQDGTEFNASDVDYTVAVLQNPDYKESLKSVWEGIILQKNDDYTVTFNLPKPYPLFLNNLTIGILPRHIWDNTNVADFSKSSFNLNAVGTGHYRIDGITRDKNGKPISLKMVANSFLYDSSAVNISNFEMKFYDNEDELIKGFKKKEFSSFGMYSSKSEVISEKTRGYNNYNVNIPQYVALFFNKKKNPILGDTAIKQALSYGLDKKKINQIATYGAGIVIDSPILPNYLGYNENIKKYDYDQKAALSVLSQGSWSDQNNDGVKEKDDKVLAFDLVTTNDSELSKVADNIAEQWKKIGIKINVKKVDMASLDKDYLQTRNFDILLFGESLGSDSDPYPYWHSSQTSYPGLNLSGFTNGEVDKLLEEARQTTETNVKIKDYKKFQELVADDIPAIFLYQPVYVYKIYDKVKGIDLSGITSTWDRFSNVNEWYVKYKNK